LMRESERLGIIVTGDRPLSLETSLTYHS